MAFALGCYRFGRYRKTDAPGAKLVPPDGIDVAAIHRIAEAAVLARDLAPDEKRTTCQRWLQLYRAGRRCVPASGCAIPSMARVWSTAVKAKEKAPRLRYNFQDSD